MNEEKRKNEKMKEKQRKVRETGEKIKGWGCALTILLTIPLILTVIFGVPGLIISGGLVVLYFFGKHQQKEGD